MPANTRTGYGMRNVTVASTPIIAKAVKAKAAIQRSGEGASSRRMKRSAGSSGGVAASVGAAEFTARKLPACPGHCHVNDLSPPSSSLSPDFGAGQQARLAFPDPTRPPPTLAAYHDGLR